MVSLVKTLLLKLASYLTDEPFEITYSYWDGTGHRCVIQVRKGDSIGEFLRAVRQQLALEFREIQTTSIENLLYVKEDLIIPHQHSFYELIVNKARGKSSPLFHFDVHEDVRTIADATIEKDESHAGKVAKRHRYEKNKHIFPASRWEIGEHHHLRSMIIVPEIIVSIIGGYKGKNFNHVEIKPKMIGHYLVEFSMSYQLC